MDVLGIGVLTREVSQVASMPAKGPPCRPFFCFLVVNKEKKVETNQDQQLSSLGRKPVNGAAIGWGIAALVIATLGCTFNNSPMVLRAGIFAKLFAVIVGTGLGLLGALIGDAIRRFAQPDFILTNGGMASLIWIRIFWKIGPQAIGLFVGVAIGCAMVLR
jgi:hypothetical protein